MGLTQLLDRETLGGLGAPEDRAIRGVLNHALGVDPLDRVGDRCRRDHGRPGIHRGGTPIHQGRIHQAARPVVDQDRARLRRKGRQAVADRVLTGVPPLDPLHGPVGIGRLHQGLDVRAVQLLPHHPNPANAARRQGCVQGPSQHGTSTDLEQQLVALRTHPPTATSTGNQQMHDALLRTK